MTPRKPSAGKREQWVIDQHGVRRKKKPRTRSDWAIESRAKRKWRK